MLDFHRIASNSMVRTTAGKSASSFAALSVFLLAILSAILFSAASAQAQSGDAHEVAPPPLKLLSKEELTRLASETDVKKRTKLAIELMDTRITQSELSHSQQDFDEMFKQLGSFHGIMDNTLDFLDPGGRGGRGSGKVLNNLKRLELELRKFRPRLELLRREVPPKYEPYVGNLIKYLREARSRAVEPLFGDTVLPKKKT